MPELFFYNLEGRGVGEVLPQLLEKTLERGWRAVVELGSREPIPQLSQKIWGYKPDGFLPHASEGDAAHQPIWLTAGPDNPNHAQARFYVEGATPGDIAGLERAVYVFEATDESAVEVARARWKQAKAEGTPARYFSFKDGRWQEQKG